MGLAGDLSVHGNTTIGDSADDTLVVDATSEFRANANFDKDIHVKGDAVIDGSTEIGEDLNVHGDTILDGKFFAKGAAKFGDNVDIAKDLTVGGDAKVDGDIYGRSFNVGDERYIDKDGINANDHKIRNVADGDIGAESTDAVNGRQLYNTREHLDRNIQAVGAQAAAMATLHPLDWDKKDKVSVSASVGGYKSEVAGAVGAYYRPDKKSMFSLQSAFGKNDNMFGIGFSKKFGEEETEDSLEDVSALREMVVSLQKEVVELKSRPAIEDSLELRKLVGSIVGDSVKGVFEDLGNQVADSIMKKTTEQFLGR